jgi:hypothetical protein
MPGQPASGIAGSACPGRPVLATAAPGGITPTRTACRARIRSNVAPSTDREPPRDPHEMFGGGDPERITVRPSFRTPTQSSCHSWIHGGSGTPAIAAPPGPCSERPRCDGGSPETPIPGRYGYSTVTPWRWAISESSFLTRHRRPMSPSVPSQAPPTDGATRQGSTHADTNPGSTPDAHGEETVAA